VPNPEADSVVPNALAVIPAPVEEIVHEAVQTAAPLIAQEPAAIQAPAPIPEPAVEPVAPAVVVETPVVAAPPVAEEPIAIPQQPAAVAQPSPAPVAPQPLKLEWSSDLQQVETKAERALAAADDGAPKRVKRVRPPAEAVVNEQLQQVETRD
jgi:ribonuclease E